MIKVEELECQYNNTTIFDGVNIEIQKGCWLLKGENGAGKSTLLRILGNNLKSLKKRGLTLKSAEMKIEEEVLLLEDDIEIPLSLKERDLYKMIMDINNMKIDNDYPVLYEDKKLYSYSMGERKMVILKIIAQLEIKVLLMDEFLVNLDEGNFLKAMKLLKNMEKNGTIVIISSNDSYAKSMFSSVMEIKNKKVYLSEK